MRPVRGQILLLRGAPGRLGPTVNNGDNYLVPRRDGRILVGSTMRTPASNAFTTPEALARLRAAAHAIFRRRATWSRRWTGPVCARARPIACPTSGAWPSCRGWCSRRGHYRNGILLAPVTAALLSELLAGRAPSADLSPFAPRPIDPEAALVPVP